MDTIILNNFDIKLVNLLYLFKINKFEVELNNLNNTTFIACIVTLDN
jgi:hypothetical protein